MRESCQRYTIANTLATLACKLSTRVLLRTAGMQQSIHEATARTSLNQATKRFANVRRLPCFGERCKRRCTGGRGCHSSSQRPTDARRDDSPARRRCLSHHLLRGSQCSSRQDRTPAGGLKCCVGKHSGGSPPNATPRLGVSQRSCVAKGSADSDMRITAWSAHAFMCPRLR